MIKKKVLCSSVVVMMILLSKLYSNQKTGRLVDMDIAKLESQKAFTHTRLDSVEKQESYWNSITFAEESVPLEIPAVKSKLNTYLNKFSYKKQQSYWMHKKADKHLPTIAAILLSYDIPEDFKYIPLIESGLDPKITSHKGAGGYWQFIPSTARLYGLKVNDSVDERLDLTKSTHAAAKYLKSLYAEFGDWALVAAAYNVGGGSLKKSIRRQGTEDYYELKLNAETGSYVYKLISAKQVVEHPGRFGYKRLAKSNDNAASSDPEMI